jgi:hypothetical protein
MWLPEKSPWTRYPIALHDGTQYSVRMRGTRSSYETTRRHTISMYITSSCVTGRESPSVCMRKDVPCKNGLVSKVNRASCPCLTTYAKFQHYLEHVEIDDQPRRSGSWGRC